MAIQSPAKLNPPARANGQQGRVNLRLMMRGKLNRDLFSRQNGGKKTWDAGSAGQKKIGKVERMSEDGIYFPARQPLTSFRA